MCVHLRDSAGNFHSVGITSERKVIFSGRKNMSFGLPPAVKETKLCIKHPISKYLKHPLSLSHYLITHFYYVFFNSHFSCKYSK